MKCPKSVEMLNVSYSCTEVPTFHSVAYGSVFLFSLTLFKCFPDSLLLVFCLCLFMATLNVLVFFKGQGGFVYRSTD